MPTNFPNSLDSLDNPANNSLLSNPSHSEQHKNANDAIEAVQAKVGITNSDDPNSLDYRVRTVENDLNNSLGDYVLLADVGQPDGVASLDSNGKVPEIQLPPLNAATATPSTRGTVYGITYSDVASLGYQSLAYGENPAYGTVAIGYSSGATIRQGQSRENTAVGTSTMSNGTPGDYNTAIGSLAGYSLQSSASDNVLIGKNAGADILYGSNNIVLGSFSSFSSSSVSNEITIGNSNHNRFRIPGLGIDWTPGNVPTAGGGGSSSPAEPYTRGTVFGLTTGYSWTPGTPIHNTYLGSGAGAGFASGNRNTIIGAQTIYGNTNPTGSNIISIGAENFTFLTSGSDNILIGNYLAQFVTSGSYNIISGSQAGNQMTTASYNLILGAEAGWNVTSGSYNVYLGPQAGYASGRSSHNIGIGRYNLRRGNDMHHNIALGYDALGYQSWSSYNIGIGYQAGNNLNYGDNNIAIGKDSQFSAANTANEIVIGNPSISRFRIPGLGIDWTPGNVPSGASAATPTQRGTVFGRTSNTNTALGLNSLTSVSDTSGLFNTAVGNDSLLNNTESHNTAVGNASLTLNTSGQANTAVGSGSLESNTVRNYLTGIGYRALSSNSLGTNNTATGAFALTLNTTGSNNTSNGSSSLNSNTTGSTNTSTGSFSLFSNTTGSGNVSTGRESLFSNTIGFDNTAIGKNAMYNNTTGYYNTAIGSAALNNNTVGLYNTAIGMSAGVIVEGNNNTLIGFDAQPSSASASNEVSIGDSNVSRFRIPGLGIDWAPSTVPSATPNAGPYTKGKVLGLTEGQDDSNTAIGYAALRNANPGINSTAFGYASLYNLTSGSGSTAFGQRSLFSVTSSNGNSAFGSSSLQATTTGDSNSSFGTNNLINNTSGYSNTSFGYAGLNNNTVGSENTTIGYYAGSTLTTGSNNIVIGNNSQPSSVSISNEITLGNSSSNKFRIPGLGIDWNSDTSPGTAWVDYTPTLNADGGGFSLNNGTLSGRYKKIGKTVHFYAKFVFGSTTSPGDGHWNFSLPFAAQNPNFTFSAAILDNGNAWYGGIGNGNYTGSTSSFAVIIPGTSASVTTWATVGNGGPFIWTTGDNIVISGTYEAA